MIETMSWVGKDVFSKVLIEIRKSTQNIRHISFFFCFLFCKLRFIYAKLALTWLCRRGWAWTPDSPTSSTWVFGLQACAIILGFTVLEHKSEALCILGMHSPKWPTSHPSSIFLSLKIKHDISCTLIILCKGLAKINKSMQITNKNDI